MFKQTVVYLSKCPSSHLSSLDRSERDSRNSCILLHSNPTPHITTHQNSCVVSWGESDWPSHWQWHWVQLCNTTTTTTNCPASRYMRWSVQLRLASQWWLPTLQCNVFSCGQTAKYIFLLKKKFSCKIFFLSPSSETPGQARAGSQAAWWRAETTVDVLYSPPYLTSTIIQLFLRQC